jgi:quinol monooxygenase YgiN
MHILLVHIHVKPECLDAFEAATAKNASASRREPGVVRFDVLRQRDDPTRFVLVEVYRTPDAAAAHKITSHYLEWKDAVPPYMAGPRVGTTYFNMSPPDQDW